MGCVIDNAGDVVRHEVGAARKVAGQEQIRDICLVGSPRMYIFLVYLVVLCT